MGIRARSFCIHLNKHWDVSIAYKTSSRFQSVVNNLILLFKFKPKKIVVLDCHFSGVIAAIVYFLFTGKSYVLDTGDAIFHLGKAIGRGNIGQISTYLLEKVGMSLANRIIVRGRSHLKYLGNKANNAVWIPDGVDVQQFQVSKLNKFSPLSKIVIGMVGSLIWNNKSNFCYGMELIDVVYGLSKQQKVPVEGIIIGDGSGLENLKKKTSELGLTEKIKFLGRVDYNELPDLIAMFSIALSNQTNNIVGEVRTTGKLPLYLASGCFIISTNIGEASRVLPNEMLVDCSGEYNFDFPQKCVELILNKMNKLDTFVFDEGPSIAKKLFDYSRLSACYETAISTKFSSDS